LATHLDKVRETDLLRLKDNLDGTDPEQAVTVIGDQDAQEFFWIAL
jgi:hypothetical protein